MRRLRPSVAVLTIGLTDVSVAWLKRALPVHAEVTDGTAVVLRETGRWRTDRMNSVRQQGETSWPRLGKKV